MDRKFLLEMLGVLIVGFIVGLIFARPLGVVAPTPTDESEFCIQVITPARNPETGEVRDFPTPCDVPEEWEMLTDNLQPTTYNLDTADWKTYRNEEYGFEFKYPEDYILSEADSEYTEFNCAKYPLVSARRNQDSLGVVIIDIDKGCSGDYPGSYIPSDQDADRFIRSYFSLGSDDVVSRLNFNDYKATSFVESGGSWIIIKDRSPVLFGIFIHPDDQKMKTIISTFKLYD